MTNKCNLLFICSRNQWRSPTAETIWKKSAAFNVRSAGTSPKARQPVSANDIRWADIIFVMEPKHKNRLLARFTRMLAYKKVYVLHIPDNYQYMDAELITELKAGVTRFLAS